MVRKNRYQRLLDAQNINADAFNSGFYSTPVDNTYLPKADDGWVNQTVIKSPYGYNTMPWGTGKEKSYGDLTWNDQEFNADDSGEFTTSKIEKDRQKNLELWDEQQDWLTSENPDWEDNPLRKKSWTLHNPTDEEMYYDPYNPTKLFNKEDWDIHANEGYASRVMRDLNKRHELNPNRFQKVTGFDPTTKEITYEGDMLSGDIASRDNPNAYWLGFNEDNEYAGGLYADKEGDITANIHDPYDQIAEEQQQYSYKPTSAQIGFETEEPYSSPRSQMDTLRPISTLSRFVNGGDNTILNKFPHGGSHGLWDDDMTEEDRRLIHEQYTSNFDTQDELFGTDNVSPGMYDDDIYHFNPDLEETIDEDPYDEYQWASEPMVTEVEEEKKKKDKDGHWSDVFGALVPGLGMINQMLENRPKNRQNQQLAHNQFMADTRDSRGVTDFNTGYQFQDKRIRSRKGAYGTEIPKAQDGDQISISDLDPSVFSDEELMKLLPYYIDSENFGGFGTGSNILHPDSMQFDNNLFNPYHNINLDQDWALEELGMPFGPAIRFDDENQTYTIKRPEGLTDEQWMQFQEDYSTDEYSDWGNYQHQFSGIEGLHPGVTVTPEMQQERDSRWWNPMTWKPFGHDELAAGDDTFQNLEVWDEKRAAQRRLPKELIGDKSRTFWDRSLMDNLFSGLWNAAKYTGKTAQPFLFANFLHNIGKGDVGNSAIGKYVLEPLSNWMNSIPKDPNAMDSSSPLYSGWGGPGYEKSKSPYCLLFGIGCDEEVSSDNLNLDLPSSSFSGIGKDLKFDDLTIAKMMRNFNKKKEEEVFKIEEDGTEDTETKDIKIKDKETEHEYVKEKEPQTYWTGDEWVSKKDYDPRNFNIDKGSKQISTDNQYNFNTPDGKNYTGYYYDGNWHIYDTKTGQGFYKPHKKGTYSSFNKEELIKDLEEKGLESTEYGKYYPQYPGHWSSKLYNMSDFYTNPDQQWVQDFKDKAKYGPSDMPLDSDEKKQMCYDLDRNLVDCNNREIILKRATKNKKKEDGGRIQQLRNRQYDDIDTTLDLDENIIKELISAGADIEYL